MPPAKILDEPPETFEVLTLEPIYANLDPLRGTKVDWAAFNYVIEEVSAGRTLRAVLDDENAPLPLPSYARFIGWLMNDHSERDLCNRLYSRARMYSALRMADEIIDIADDTRGDISTTPKGDVVWDTTHIARSKLQVETRMKLLEKMLPRLMGGTGDAGNPMIDDVRTLLAAGGANVNPDVTDNDRASELMRLLAKAAARVGKTDTPPPEPDDEEDDEDPPPEVPDEGTRPPHDKLPPVVIADRDVEVQLPGELVYRKARMRKR